MLIQPSSFDWTMFASMSIERLSILNISFTRDSKMKSKKFQWPKLNDFFEDKKLQKRNRVVPIIGMHKGTYSSVSGNASLARSSSGQINDVVASRLTWMKSERLTYAHAPQASCVISTLTSLSSFLSISARACSWNHTWKKPFLCA